MKKVFLTLILIATTVTVWAQSQLTTVRGKTKDGKTIKVEYYKGSVEDVIQSVKYQVVEELQSDVEDLQSKTKTVQGKLDDANRQVKDLQERLKNCVDLIEMERLKKELAEKESQIEGMNETIAELRQQIKEKETQISACEHVIDSLKNNKLSAPTPVIGVEVGCGPTFPGNSIGEPWAKEVKSCLQADVYFGSARLSESFPVSVEAGLGIHKFGMAARLNEYGSTINAVDADGDNYQAIYAFDGLEESLSLTYLDVPIRLCFGQPAKNRVTVYAKIGITPSIKVASAFEGKGKYSLKGYYPHWDVTLENVAQLGFGSDMDCYDDVAYKIITFNLWGDVAFGAYIPFKGSPIILNAGIKLDYPFMAIGSINEDEKLPDGKAGLLRDGGKVLIPSVGIGLVYTLK